MAERRMLNKGLLLKDNFMRLSRPAFSLYIYLCMLADDDGFVDNADVVYRICRCSAKHRQELVDGGWVIPFDSGVLAVTHWHMHNQIKKDRYKPTAYQTERAMLEKTGTGIYVLREPDRVHFGSNLEPQGSIEQDRIEKERKEQDRIDQNSTGQQAPVSPGPPAAACDDIDFERFLSLYHMSCPALEPCQAVTDEIRRKVRLLLQDGHSMGWITSAFLKAGQSPFLCGENKRGWKADLAWLVEPDNLQRIMDGKYDDW